MNAPLAPCTKPVIQVIVMTRNAWTYSYVWQATMKYTPHWVLQYRLHLTIVSLQNVTKMEQLVMRRMEVMAMMAAVDAAVANAAAVNAAVVDAVVGAKRSADVLATGDKTSPVASTIKRPRPEVLSPDSSMTQPWPR